VRPVIAAARDDADLAGVEMNGEPVAVPFNMAANESPPMRAGQVRSVDQKIVVVTIARTSILAEGSIKTGCRFLPSEQGAGCRQFCSDAIQAVKNWPVAPS